MSKPDEFAVSAWTCKGLNWKNEGRDNLTRFLHDLFEGRVGFQETHPSSERKPSTAVGYTQKPENFTLVWDIVYRSVVFHFVVQPCDLSYLTLP